MRTERSTRKVNYRRPVNATTGSNGSHSSGRQLKSVALILIVNILIKVRFTLKFLDVIVRKGKHKGVSLKSARVLVRDQRRTNLIKVNDIQGGHDDQNQHVQRLNVSLLLH